MKAIMLLPLLQLALTGTDFHMLQAPTRHPVSYQMLAGPVDAGPEADSTTGDARQVVDPPRHGGSATRRGSSANDPTSQRLRSADAAEDPRRKRLLVYTAPWCGPCRRFQSMVVPKLVAAGWEVGDESTDHVQLVEVGETLPAGIEALPTFVLLEDGRESRRQVGFLDAWGVGELVKGYREHPIPTLPRSGRTPEGSVQIPRIRQGVIPWHRHRCWSCGGFHAITVFR